MSAETSGAQFRSCAANLRSWIACRVALNAAIISLDMVNAMEDPQIPQPDDFRTGEETQSCEPGLPGSRADFRHENRAAQGRGTVAAAIVSDNGQPDRSPVHSPPRSSPQASAGAACLAGGVFRDMERVKGIEPSSLAWEANALPLSYTRNSAGITASQRTRQAGLPARPNLF